MQTAKRAALERATDELRKEHETLLEMIDVPDRVRGRFESGLPVDTSHLTGSS